MWAAIWSILKLVFQRRNAMKQRERGLAERGANEAVMQAYAAGDYVTALAVSEGLRDKGRETQHYCFYQGALRRHLGRASEAEPWLRRAIELTPEPQFAALEWEALGEAFLEEGRYDEARAAFEQSLLISPERGSSDRGIAETWLRQGAQPGLALRRAEAAVRKQRALRGAPAAQVNLGEDLALLAWAVAAAEPDPGRVHALAAEALGLCPPSAGVPSAAQVRFHLGCAYTVLGDEANSRRHYHETMQLDAQGHWGAAAGTVVTAS